MLRSESISQLNRFVSEHCRYSPNDFPTLITTASQQGQLPSRRQTHTPESRGQYIRAYRAQAVLEIDTIYAVQSSSGRIPLEWVTAVEKNAQIDVLVRNTDPGRMRGAQQVMVKRCWEGQT